VAGLATNDFAQIWLGGGAGSAAQNGAFQVANVRDGTHDLVAWRHNLLGTGNPDRGLVRRDQNIANGGSVGTLDFGGADAFTPATASITVTGSTAGEQLTHGMGYSTGACVYANLYQGPVTTSGSTMTASGFPASHQRATDLHQLSITAISGTFNRVVQEHFRALADRTVALPPPVGAPTVTTLAAPYKRLQAAVAVPGEYNAAAILHYADQTNQRTASITATFAWIGGAAATLAMPDLSAVTGWNNDWVPASASTGMWLVQLIGNNLTGGSLCEEGGRVSSIQLMGTH
jgi:hypothetical protein